MGWVVWGRPAEAGQTDGDTAGQGLLIGLTIQLIRVVLTGHQGIENHTDCATNAVHLQQTTVFMLLLVDVTCAFVYVCECVECVLGGGGGGGARSSSWEFWLCIWVENCGSAGVGTVHSVLVVMLVTLSLITLSVSMQPCVEMQIHSTFPEQNSQGVSVPETAAGTSLDLSDQANVCNT